MICVMQETENHTNNFRQLKPIKKLEDFIHLFWTHRNPSNQPEHMTVVPDGYAKIIFFVENGEITRYFMAGLFIHEINYSIPPGATLYGCKLKILAPEYLINQEMASILQNLKQLELSYLNLKYFDLSSFEIIVQQWQAELLKIKSPKEIPGNKLRLSQLLEKIRGELTAKEVSEQIYWTNKQINRYMNKYLGVSLKKYLNIQKVCYSYNQIMEGDLYPENFYFDQAHFIREIKKHTGSTPKTLNKEQDQRFIQIKRMTKG